MRDSIRRRFSVLTAILQLCVEYAATFAGNDLAQGLIATLQKAWNGAKAGFGTITDAEGATRTAIEQRVTARIALADSVTRIVQARPDVALDAKVEIPFHKPLNRNDLDLIEQAESISRNSGALLDDFEAHGVSKTVFSALPAQVAALKKGMDAVKEGLRNQAAGRTAAEEALQLADRPLRVLTRIFLNAMKDDAQAATKWRTARRVGPRSHPHAAQQPAAATTSPTTPSETTTKTA